MSPSSDWTEGGTGLVSPDQSQSHRTLQPLVPVSSPETCRTYLPLCPVGEAGSETECSPACYLPCGQELSNRTKKLVAYLREGVVHSSSSPKARAQRASRPVHSLTREPSSTCTEPGPLWPGGGCRGLEQVRGDDYSFPSSGSAQLM